MTTALVVDDSTIDRELVRSLLANQSSLDILFAGNGVEAVELITTESPDIIITDLHMPKMNGLQLVQHVHTNHASIPIVLITGHGSEDLAVQALKNGASNYVPKSRIARDLIPTVMHTLAAARASHSLKAVRNCWEQNASTFRIPNDYNLIAPLIHQLMEIVEGMQLFDSAARLQLSVALEEALSNALYHGNLEITAEQLKSVGYDLFDPDAENIVDVRRASPPYTSRQIRIDCKLNRAEARFTITDDGPGFAHANLPKPEETLSSDDAGQGLAKMQLFTDELQFNEQGNQVTLVKRA